MKWLKYLVVIVSTVIIVSSLWIFLFNKTFTQQNSCIELFESQESIHNFELDNLKHFCVIEYCETPQYAGEFRSLKSQSEKGAEMTIFCDELHKHFLDNVEDSCTSNPSNWGDSCLGLDKRIEMFCNGLEE